MTLPQNTADISRVRVDVPRYTVANLYSIAKIIPCSLHWPANALASPFNSRSIYFLLSFPNATPLVDVIGWRIHHEKLIR